MSDLASSLNRAAQLLARAQRVAVLTGAGISAESGVPTFRAAGGLWEGHRIEDVASPAGFARNPRLVWQFYNARRANLATVTPNAGHYALAQLERRWGEQFTLVTQNVDGLHQAAGSQRVVELHGALRRTRCTGCGQFRDAGLQPLAELPHCAACGALLRPDIVWFHEALPTSAWEAAEAAARNCEVLLVVGTAAVVYPAAGLILLAKENGAPGASIIECNLAPTEASYLADIGLYGPAGAILPQLLAAHARAASSTQA